MILASHGIISSISTVDADWLAYYNRVIAAGGSLTTTEQNATKQLVSSLKANGLWTPMKAIYPMVGASAAACAQNLKSASFTGTFNGTWIFASTGATPNGSNGYMNTGFIPSSHFNSLNDKSFGCYLGTNVNGGIDMGMLGDGYTGDQITGRISDMAAGYISDSSGIVSSTDSRGFWIATRSSSTLANFYKNGTNIAIKGNSISQGSYSIVIGARSLNGFIEAFSSKRFQFEFIGDGLTDTQAANFYTIVQAFQTTLSRNV